MRTAAPAGRARRPAPSLAEAAAAADRRGNRERQAGGREGGPAARARGGGGGEDGGGRGAGGGWPLTSFSARTDWFPVVRHGSFKKRRKKEPSSERPRRPLGPAPFPGLKEPRSGRERRAPPGTHGALGRCRGGRA